MPRSRTPPIDASCPLIQASSGENRDSRSTSLVISAKMDDRFLTIAFWSQEEFLAHSHYVTERSQLTKSIAWADGSYSKAWYQLAVVESKQGLFERALFWVDCGLQLEPDHPELWNEKGYLLGRLKRHQEAFDCYARAATVRDWAPPSQVARALRGQGVQLIDLRRGPARCFRRCAGGGRRPEHCSSRR